MGNAEFQRSLRAWRSPLSRRIVLFSALVLIALHIAHVVFVLRLIHVAEEAATETREAHATVLAEHASRTIGAIDMALINLATEVSASSDFNQKSLSLHTVLHEAAMELPQLYSIVALDEDGVVIQDSRHYPATFRSYADAEGFREVKRRHGDGLVIARPIPSRVNSEVYWPMERGVLDSNGKLRGVIAAVTDPTSYMTFYEQSLAVSGGAAALARTDGAVLAAFMAPGHRHPATDLDIAGFLRAVEHTASVVRAVPGFPLQIVVASPPIWADRSLRTYIGADALFMLMVTLLAVIGSRTLVKEARARERADLRLRDAIDSVPAGFTLFDAEDRLVTSNETYERIYGFPEGVVRPGIKFRELVEIAFSTGLYELDGATVAEAIERRLAQHRKPQGQMTQHLAGDRWVLTRWQHTKEGGAVCFNTDITEMKAQEKMLLETSTAERAAREQAEAADQAKSAFLATMSHELRTPLNAVIGFSDVIAEQRFGPGSSRYVEYGQLIHNSGQHLLKIINDILDIAKLRAGRTELQLQPVDPGLSMREALRILQQQAQAKDIELCCATDLVLPKILADPTRLQQVLMNLLSNAVKFTPAGGKVTLAARNDRDGVTFEVADTGIGMAADDIPRALEPFGQIENAMTRTQEGTGLGLPLTRNLVELHGGSFEIASEPGRGTVVRVTFPHAEPSGPTRSASSKSAA